MIQITIPLAPVTKKNSQRILQRYDRKRQKTVPFIAQSEKYKAYEQAAGWYIKGKGDRIDYPVNVKCIYYMPTKRRVDLVNLQEATLDILTHYEVLADDNSQIVVSMDGSRVEHDKDNPRTEIVITRKEQT